MRRVRTDRQINSRDGSGGKARPGRPPASAGFVGVLAQEAPNSARCARVLWMQRDRWGRTCAWTGRQRASAADKGQQGASTLRERIGGLLREIHVQMLAVGVQEREQRVVDLELALVTQLRELACTPAPALLQRVRSPTSHHDDRLSWCVHTTRRVRASFEFQCALESARDLLAQYLQPSCARCGAQRGLVDTRSV